LAEGAQRIYAFESGGAAWDGQWLVVLVSVPESSRALRHKLQTQLSWAGFGSPSPGVWISPHQASQAEVSSIVNELQLTDRVMSFVAEYGAVGSQEAMVAQAWDLGQIERRYQDFITAFAELDPRTPDDVLVAQLRLVHEWRRFPFLDPRLPRLLLPPHWSGASATGLFVNKHTMWRDAARRRWSELAADRP
jgi:phenylacetic acid degradation operon negative regulatory protein